MAQVLFDFDDFVVMDSGVVAVRWPRLVEHLRDGHELLGIKALPDESIDIYNRRRDPAHHIPIIRVNDSVDGVPTEAYQWRLPPHYHDLDIPKYLAACLIDKFPEPTDVYIDRCHQEWQMMQERGMEDFLRLLIYMVSRFEKTDVLRGIGRGSGCASLVLYLIGIHMVDPVFYEIPINEFLR